MPNNSAIKLMAHLVAGFPSIDESYTVARALADGGADFLEVQFPFSDPSADGKPIQAACSAALSAGTKVADGFSLVKKISRELKVPVFIMTYAGPVYALGVENFVKRSLDAGAEGIIAPDLMPGYDEGLYSCGRDHGFHIVPVISPQVSEERLSLIKAEKPRYLYCALRSGITGDITRLDTGNISFLHRVRSVSPVVMAGFGIQSSAQVAALAPYADAAIVGSALVNEIRRLPQSAPSELYASLKRKVESLRATVSIRSGKASAS